MSSVLVLLCVGALLGWARSQDPYSQLPDTYKLGVDLALENLHSLEGVQHHFRFLRTLKKSDISSGFGVTYYFHHFYLKPTRCPRGTGFSEPERCPFRNDRPLMDCAVCYKVSADQMEASPKPYVHCIQRPRLTEEIKSSRTDHCRKLNYNSGAPTLLAVSMG
ncbi:uncharacterized protein ACB058_001440 [Synchiropus picturatus]